MTILVNIANFEISYFCFVFVFFCFFLVDNRIVSAGLQ